MFILSCVATTGKQKNLCMCGNFNMTNIGDVFEILTEQGQCPRIYSDTNILLGIDGTQT